MRSWLQSKGIWPRSEHAWLDKQRRTATIVMQNGCPDAQRAALRALRKRAEVHRETATEAAPFGSRPFACTQLLECLGLHRARLEMKILFEAILDREAAVKPAGEAKRASSTFVGGLKTLPLKVTPV